MWIMIAGPYTSGAKTEEERARNLIALNEAALAVFEKGHVPIVGVNIAMPIIEYAGAGRFNEIMMPVSLAVAERCDACLRIGGKSQGAERELELFRRRGLPVFGNVDEIPEAELDRSGQN